MYWLLLIITFHILSYVIIFRHFTVFRNEKVILAFHVILFIPVFIGIIIAWLMQVIEIPILLSLISLELIYNMTFLGLWSLIQGSYSIQILTKVAMQQPVSETDIISETAYIGLNKRQNRLNHLIAMRLAKKISVDKIAITKLGQVVGHFFQKIKFLAHIKTAG